MDAGWFCAESVVAELAHRQGIESDLLPAIATGFCGGVSRRDGMCGAVSGAVMAIGLVNGRKNAKDSRESTYAAVQALVDGFAKEFGSANCSELLGLRLGTDDGRAEFRARGLMRRCRGFTCRAAEMAAEIIDRIVRQRGRRRGGGRNGGRDMTSIATAALQAGPVAPGDFGRLVDLLEAEGLPSGDLREPGVRLFVFRDGGAAIGYAGLEVYGTDALLRSVVVDPTRRRAGVGRSIVEATLAEARRLGATRVFLLTNTAKTYFERLGFVSIDRASAPETILSTRQAAGLCPSSAPLMVKTLV
jgi:amino-acid N-acetyltransferase